MPCNGTGRYTASQICELQQPTATRFFPAPGNAPPRARLPPAAYGACGAIAASARRTFRNRAQRACRPCGSKHRDAAPLIGARRQHGERMRWAVQCVDAMCRRTTGGPVPTRRARQPRAAHEARRQAPRRARPGS
eukprot:365377-Chlamydomonas_euryale.AAC.18